MKKLVVSHPDNGVNHYGLTDVGKKQAVEVSAGSASAEGQNWDEVRQHM